MFSLFHALQLGTPIQYKRIHNRNAPYASERNMVMLGSMLNCVCVAQWIARWTSNPKVVGSSPTVDDIFIHIYRQQRTLLQRKGERGGGAQKRYYLQDL
jgi:hypothetical protein